MEENKEEDVKRNTDEPIYVMTVELEKGKNETIKIYIDSKPDELAYDFCKEHNLDFSSLSYLTSQIKALFESLPQANQSNSKQNDECIVEEEDEENQTSEYKGANSNNSNNLIISNEVLQTDTDNFEPVKNLKMLEQSEEQLQDLDEHYQIEDDSKEKKNNDVIYQRASIFSYKEFYNRFKENVILKHNENHFNHTSTCKEKKKEIGKLRPAMTIEQNKKMIPIIKNLFQFILAAAEAARVYILPKGCIEHYYTQSKILYMPVSGKDKLFRIELDFLQDAHRKTVMKNYSELISLLEKATSL